MQLVVEVGQPARDGLVEWGLGDAMFDQLLDFVSDALGIAV